ncbi:MAG: outer membrane beta-barrel protein [Micropepsaceae bacterium]
MTISRSSVVRRCFAISLIALGALVIDFDSAFADDEGGADVLSRARPEYDARGVRAGTFFLYPSITGGVSYSDNVFNGQSNIDDYFYALSPQIRLNSDWARHALNLSAEAKSHWYDTQSSEDRTDWSVSADGRIDIARGSDIKVEAHHIELHEARGTDQTGGFAVGDPAEPTGLSRTGVSGEIGYAFNRLRLSAGGSLENIDYEDTPCVTACVPPVVPAVINNDDRDRTVVDVFAKVAFEAAAGAALFVRGRWMQHDFDAGVDDDGFNRDSDGWGIDGGLEFSMTHVLVGEVFAGYLVRRYDDPAFDDAAEFAFGAAVKWFPSMLTTVSVDASRTIEDTSIGAASGYVSSQGQIGVDHELLRNLILSGRFGYENAEYQESARSDDILRASLGGRLLINNNLHFDAEWQFIDRSSSDAAFDYETNQFTISLTVKL